MRQLRQKLSNLTEHRQEETVYIEQMEQFAQTVLERYRTGIRRLPLSNLLHLKTLSLQTEKEPVSVTNISNWNVQQIRERETISKLLYKIQNLDTKESQTQKKVKQDSTRIEKLERQIKESAGAGQKLLKRIQSQTEREIRSVREDTLFHTRVIHRNMQQIELESRKQIRETIQEGFQKELRILRRIQEERQDVLLVYPDLRWYLTQGRQSAGEEPDSSFFSKQQSPKSNPVFFRQFDSRQEPPDAPEKQEIREIVKEQIQDQAGLLTEKIYRRLERQLLDEKKRRGF